MNEYVYTVLKSVRKKMMRCESYGEVLKVYRHARLWNRVESNYADNFNWEMHTYLNTRFKCYRDEAKYALGVRSREK